MKVSPWIIHWEARKETKGTHSGRHNQPRDDIVIQGVGEGDREMDLAALADNLGLEEDEFLQIVALFIEKSSADLLELEVAIDKGDFQQVVEVSHSIKGASVNLGFTEIYEVAEGVEMNAKEQSLKGAEKAARFMKEKLDQVEKNFMVSQGMHTA